MKRIPGDSFIQLNVWGLVSMMIVMNKDSEKNSSITLKLTPKGVYHWSIFVPMKDGDTPSSLLSRLDKLDHELKRMYPNHAKRTSTSTKSFNFLD